MPNEKMLQAWINPLAFLEVDELLTWALTTPVDYEAVLKYLCTPGIDSDVGSLTDRYREIAETPSRLFAVPAEDRILAKLVWPLRHAKGSYMVGNYLGTISLCGVVAEMVALLLFEISDISINGRTLDKGAEKELLGSTFEGLGQYRRVEVLSAYNLIDVKQKSQFDTIRLKRRRHLHLYSQNLDQLAPDAKEMFTAAVTLVESVIGHDIRNGKIVLSPSLEKYLEERGILESQEQDGAENVEEEESENRSPNHLSEDI